MSWIQMNILMLLLFCYVSGWYSGLIWKRTCINLHGTTGYYLGKINIKGYTRQRHLCKSFILKNWRNFWWGNCVTCLNDSYVLVIGYSQKKTERLLASYIHCVYVCVYICYRLKLRFNSTTVAITIWLTATKYLKWRRCFLSSITDKTLIRLDYIYIYEHHRGCLIRSRKCVPIANIWIHSWVLVESILLIYLVLCIVLCCAVFSCVLFLFVFVLTLVCLNGNVPIVSGLFHGQAFRYNTLVPPI